MKRREVIKNLSLLPVTGALLGGALPLNSMLAAPAEAAAAKPKRDLFKELGLRTFINAAGTITTLSGSLMYDEVIEVINYSAKEFATINEVQDKVGAKIAAICHAEAAYVTAGCWSAVVLGTAGVLTGMDGNKVGRLPNLEGMKSEVIVQKTHSSGYVHAVKNTGAKIVVIETAEELGKAVNEKTAMLWFLNYAGPEGKISNEEWVTLGKKFGIPTMLDMAADVPPVENLWKYNDMGYDLVAISGGKALRGPQSAGILMGKKNLIAAARLNSPPAAGNIGRGMKVNKEEILGMYVALEKYVNTDHDKEWKMWEDLISIIENAAKKVDGVITKVTVPPVCNHTPHLNISWEINKVKISRGQLMSSLRNGDPSIEVQGNDNGILLNVFMLKPGQEKIVAKRILEELTKASV